MFHHIPSISIVSIKLKHLLCEQIPCLFPNFYKLVLKLNIMTIRHFAYTLITTIILLTHSTNIEATNTSDTTLTLSEKVNNVFTPAVTWMDKVFFWDPFATLGLYDPNIYDENGQVVLDAKGNQKKMKIPLIVIWLFAGAIFFTIKMKFINFRGIKYSIRLLRGKYDTKTKTDGEVTRFQALTTALSATVGMGNIAGVAIAISVGGPGATFWMIVMGLLGMASKFTECTLGVKYRKIGDDGQISGGPMYYLKMGLEKRGLGKLGAVLAALFALMVIGGSVGGGNMIQVNQSFAQFALLVPEVADYGFYFGVVFAILVGFVVIGGIKSIGKVTEKIVPFMALLYILAALFIIGANITKVGEVFHIIWQGAFNPGAIKGGLIGVLILGIQRGAFSNEAGIGSAAIAHSAAKTNEPVSEGLVALIEPFIDTVVICTMTALVIIFSGLHANPQGLSGAPLTSAAFETVLPWFPYVLLISIWLFAFSTMISWSYYGLKGFNYLFARFIKNEKVATYIYYAIFMGCIIIGASSQLDAVMDFSDMMILCMAFPNIVGLVILSGEVKQDLNKYLDKLKKFTNK